MDTLPQELIDKISSLLSRKDLKATLVLSRKLQYGAERHSGVFSHAKLKPDVATTRKFLSTYNSHRLLYLRGISFETSIPWIESEYDSNGIPERFCRETEDELQIINEEFTKQIGILFRTLSTLESQAGAQYRPGKIHLTIYTTERRLWQGECYHRKSMSWRVRLLSPSELPKLSSIRTLTLEVPCDDMRCHEIGEVFSCHIEYKVLLDIARRCPNLDTLECRLSGREWLGSFTSQAMNQSCQDWAGPRRDSRHSLEKAMQGIKKSLPYLRHVRLDFLYPLCWAEDFNQCFPLPDLIKPALSDPFSSSLRVLSHQLRTMDLRVVADETLFWPTESSRDVWPNMESIHIMFNNSHPSGSWYFSGQPSIGTGYVITPEHYPPLEETDRDFENDLDDATVYMNWLTNDAFSTSHTRVFPQETRLARFLEAFARAAAHMPVLKEFVLWTPIKLDVSDFEDEFPNLDPKTISKNAMEDAELHKLFQEIGQKEHGEEVREHWNDVENQDDGLDYRDWFEDWFGDWAYEA
ncbi:hypothetical protein N0V90_002965 [Kalmusia sp. IMI 367209]|nr:hypothetical protein N0V90_002965 [Kalmusia sp. IMI 367209]